METVEIKVDGQHSLKIWTSEGVLKGKDGKMFDVTTLHVLLKKGGKRVKSAAFDVSCKEKAEEGHYL